MFDEKYIDLLFEQRVLFSEEYDSLDENLNKLLREAVMQKSRFDIDFENVFTLKQYEYYKSEQLKLIKNSYKKGFSDGFGYKK